MDDRFVIDAEDLEVLLPDGRLMPLTAHRQGLDPDIHARPLPDPGPGYEPPPTGGIWPRAGIWPCEHIPSKWSG